ncbi:MAG: M14-type cytosolic carboxypeptidase [Wenzhouxiangellaceae bacterium]|nr:M14-type cytosolic carboxypeptidase [Wenzhouxiangellaceae bacterium]
MSNSMIQISSAFDGGNIEVIDASDPTAIRLRIRPDAGGEHMQWFSFQLANARGTACRLVIENAGEVSYPDGFVDYQAVASTDGERWLRVATAFDGRELVITHTPESDLIHFAYFAPYGFDRHQALIADALGDARVRAEVLCLTPDGRPLTLLTLGRAAAGKPVIWITARQHPGESMAEWWVEGFLDRLLDPADGVARALLDHAVIELVPNMNPDGSVRGHLRVNAHGVNLNRAWRDPDPETSPEVFHVRRRMHASGVDLALDVHGDEALPYNFIAGGEGVARWNAAMEADLQGFKQRLERIAPDFQTEYGYERDAPASADLRKCTDYIAETFGCLAMTLEMPFKDAANRPDAQTGWSPQRSAALGALFVDAIWQHIAESPTAEAAP